MRSNIRTVCTEDHECFLLVVEDNEGVQNYLRALFDERTKINLLFAASAREGLGVIKSKSNIELILLDLGLPDSQGIGTLRKFRNAVNGRVAIIPMSGSHDLEDDAMQVENGAVDFFAKPIDQLDLISRCKYAIMNQRKINRWQDYCENLERRISNIETSITGDSAAIQELAQIRMEIASEARAYQQGAS